MQVSLFGGEIRKSTVEERLLVKGRETEQGRKGLGILGVWMLWEAQSVDTHIKLRQGEEDEKRQRDWDGDILPKHWISGEVRLLIK